MHYIKSENGVFFFSCMKKIVLEAIPGPPHQTFGRPKERKRFFLEYIRKRPKVFRTL